MVKTTSIPLDDDSARFVEDQVSSGRYASAGDVVRAALELMKEQETKLAALRAAIHEGLQSGDAKLIDREAFYAQARARSSKTIG